MNSHANLITMLDELNLPVAAERLPASANQPLPLKICQSLLHHRLGPMGVSSQIFNGVKHKHPSVLVLPSWIHHGHSGPVQQQQIHQPGGITEIGFQQKPGIHQIGWQAAGFPNSSTAIPPFIRTRKSPLCCLFRCNRRMAYKGDFFMDEGSLI